MTLKKQEISKIFDKIFYSIYIGDFTSIVNLLNNVDVYDTLNECLVAYLSATNTIKTEPEIKNSRDLLISKIKDKFTQEIGKDRTNKILLGLY